jgi:hypothetical protein
MNAAEAALEIAEAFGSQPTLSERAWTIEAHEPVNAFAPGITKGVPAIAYRGGRGPIKRNKSRRWHAKRLAKKVR